MYIILCGVQHGFHFDRVCADEGMWEVDVWWGRFIDIDGIDCCIDLWIVHAEQRLAGCCDGERCSHHREQIRWDWTA